MTSSPWANLTTDLMSLRTSCVFARTTTLPAILVQCALTRPLYAKRQAIPWANNS